MKSRQLNREDLLLLTRRMNPERASITRIAGCYMDEGGEFDGSFNVAFGNLSKEEKKQNLEIAKAVLLSETNKELVSREVPPENQKPGSFWQLLLALRDCGLKNDALMDSLYEIVERQKPCAGAHSILVFHDRYDIPAKGMDKQRQGESEYMFEYLICAVCPLVGEYESGKPVWGFLFPEFSAGGAVLNFIDFYKKR